MSGFDDIEERLEERRRQQMYRRRRVVQSAQGRTLQVGGRELLNLCSNDYLGLAGDPRIAAALARGAARWGTGSGASHLICGHTEAHHELEEALARFTDRPRCLLFSSGYAANMGVINGLLSVGDRVYEDRLNHASLLDGGWISRAEFAWYPHRDSEALATILGKETGSDARRLIVSDGVFSMDGDTCPVAPIAKLAREHGAWLMIDDAHGFGVLGEEGRGTVDPGRHGVEDVQVLVGTLGKSFGTHGAFVAGSEALIETLIQRARTYVFTTALPAAIAVATLTSLEILRSEDWRRERLAALVARFRSGARELGLALMPSATPIQPIVVGTEEEALRLSAALEDRGFLITAIRPPTVPAGTSRLRITFTANHTEADVDALLGALEADAHR